MANPNSTLAIPEPALPRSVIRSVLKSSGMKVICFIFELSRPTCSRREARIVSRIGFLICAISAIEVALVPA